MSQINLDNVQVKSADMLNLQNLSFAGWNYGS